MCAAGAAARCSWRPAIVQWDRGARDPAAPRHVAVGPALAVEALTDQLLQCVGHGWVTSVRTASHNVVATELWDNGGSLGTTQVNGLANITPPVAVPATAGLFSNLIAWQQNPGSAGPAEIRTRYAPQGDLGSEIVLSNPAQGPTDGANGLTAAGDVAGDAAVAWLQGSPGASAVVVDQLYQAPGSFSPLSTFQYARTPQPTLAWSPAKARTSLPGPWPAVSKAG